MTLRSWIDGWLNAENVPRFEKQWLWHGHLSQRSCQPHFHTSGWDSQRKLDTNTTRTTQSMQPWQTNAKWRARLSTSSKYHPVAGSEGRQDGKRVCLLPLSVSFPSSFSPDKMPWQLWPWYMPLMAWHRAHKCIFQPRGFCRHSLLLSNKGGPLCLFLYT